MFYVIFNFFFFLISLAYFIIFLGLFNLFDLKNYTIPYGLCFVDPYIITHVLKRKIGEINARTDLPLRDDVQVYRRRPPPHRRVKFCACVLILRRIRKYLRPRLRLTGVPIKNVIRNPNFFPPIHLRFSFLLQTSDSHYDKFSLILIIVMPS